MDFNNINNSYNQNNNYLPQNQNQNQEEIPQQIENAFDDTPVKQNAEQQETLFSQTEEGNKLIDVTREMYGIALPEPKTPADTIKECPLFTYGINLPHISWNPKDPIGLMYGIQFPRPIIIFKPIVIWPFIQKPSPPPEPEIIQNDPNPEDLPEHEPILVAYGIQFPKPDDLTVIPLPDAPIIEEDPNPEDLPEHEPILVAYGIQLPPEETNPEYTIIIEKPTLEVAPEPIEPEVAPEPIEPEVAPEPIEPEVAPEPIEPEVTPEPVAPEVTPEPIAPEVTPKPAEPNNSTTTNSTTGTQTGLSNLVKILGVQPNSILARIFPFLKG